MVILGGLEIVAATYLIHKHNQNKRDRALLREEAASIEEETYHLQEDPPYHRPHRRSHSREREESDEERKERHRRRRERREREKREQSAPPRIPVPVVHQQQQQQQQQYPLRQTQTPQPGGIVTGWPAHWKQSQTPPTPPPQPQMGPNGYPQDVKYGFVPEIPHDQYPPYPPPPFSPGPADRDSRGRANTLDVNDGRRGRPKARRSVSPRLGVYDEDDRSPTPQVRFSTEDVVLGERRRGGRNSPPPRYRA